MRIRRVKGHGRRATLIVELAKPSASWHVKLRPADDKKVLMNEAHRLRWAYKQGHLPVTENAVYIGMPYVGFLLTKTLAGMPAHKLIDTLGPSRLVVSLSDAMKRIQKVPVFGFPFAAPEWAVSKESSLRHIEDLDVLKLRGKKLHPDFDRLSKQGLKRVIEGGPARSKKLVLSHGDLCMPNLLFSPDGQLTGVIDLGALHAGDPLLDTALLSWCIKDNMGVKWSEYFLGLYGMSNDDPAILYYRLAYDLSLDFPDPWAWTTAPKIAERKARLAEVKI